MLGSPPGPLPRTRDRRCPGQTDRGSPAPLTSDREGAALDWPKKPIRPLISQQPGWSLLPPKEKTPPKPRHEGNLGATVRGSLDSRSCSRIVLDCRGRRATTPLDHRLLCPPKPPSLARRRRKVARRIYRRKARPAAHGARREESEAGSRPSPRPKTPRIRVRCPEGPSIKGPHRIGQSMFPGRPGTRVDRRKPWLRRQTQPRPALSTQRRYSNDPSGARVRGSVADVETTHLPPGARPAERQAANLGVTSCGGLLGDDEGPIRSGQKGASLERANRFVSAREPVITAR